VPLLNDHYQRNAKLVKNLNQLIICTTHHLACGLLNKSQYQEKGTNESLEKLLYKMDVAIIKKRQMWESRMEKI
jgi:hypothetical protein